MAATQSRMAARMVLNPGKIRIGASALLVGCALMALAGGALADDCTARAATSAALRACEAAAAKPAVPSPAAAVAAPSVQLPAPAKSASAVGEDASGKPPAAGRSGLPAKKRVSAKRRGKGPAVAGLPPEPQQPTSLFDALFGPPPPPPGSVDPATTAATGGTVSAKGKKGVKTAKAGDFDPYAGQPLPSAGGGIFGFDEAPKGSAEPGIALMSPSNVDALKYAIKRYSDIVAAGGWPQVSPLQMQVGTTNAAVSDLRDRLRAEGDLTGEPSGFSSREYFDQDVSEALRRFQARNGLAETGDLMDVNRLKNGTRTVIALNVTAQARLAQLKANLGRLQQKQVGKGRYVLVNIPAGQVEAVEDGRVALRLTGVVGRPDRPSPLLTSAIAEVKFNPTWTMPPTVLKEDLLPKGKSMQAKGQDVLAKFGIDAYDGNGRKVVDTASINWNRVGPDTYRFSQKPGKDNPLGFAKLDFPSPEAVYMHDTPSAKLFDQSYRAASSGCIRVEHMDRLVSWLLRETPNWSAGRVNSMKETGETKIVSLKRAVPLHWVYVTAWATPDGMVHFRRDLYGKDQAFGVSKTASAY